MTQENKDLVAPIKFGIAKQLRYRQHKVLMLIEKCINEKVVLNEYILQEWFMEQVVKPRRRVIDGKYLGKDAEGRNTWERISEYDKLQIEISESPTGLMKYWNLGEAKQIIKYSIGSLVVNGYLAVLPTIKLDSIDENQKQIEQL